MDRERGGEGDRVRGRETETVCLGEEEIESEGKEMKRGKRNVKIRV